MKRSPCRRQTSLASSPVESHLRWGCRATFNWASKPENDSSRPQEDPPSLKLRRDKRFGPENDILLICRISYAPGIDWQIKVLNGGVQPNPVFSVFHRFQYQNNPRFLSGLYCVICALPHRLGPTISKIKFNRVGIRHTIAARTIRQYHFNLPFLRLAPFLLIP